MKIGKKELILRDVEETEVTDDVEKEETEDMEKSFIKRHWKKILGGAALVGGAIATKMLLSRNSDDDYDEDEFDDLDDDTEDTADDTTEDK